MTADHELHTDGSSIRHAGVLLQGSIASMYMANWDVTQSTLLGQGNDIP